MLSRKISNCISQLLVKIQCVILKYVIFLVVSMLGFMHEIILSVTHFLGGRHVHVNLYTYKPVEMCFMM